jgi:hypothetical protein
MLSEIGVQSNFFELGVLNEKRCKQHSYSTPTALLQQANLPADKLGQRIGPSAGYWQRPQAIVT